MSLGFVLALGFGRFVGSLLYRVDPADPLAFLVVGVVLATITLVASAIPAQRAARANPASVLRIE